MSDRKAFRALRDEIRAGSPDYRYTVAQALKPLSSWRPAVARIRTIKPEFWTDEKTGPLSPLSKCLFLGLLGVADDHGVLRWSPSEWRAKIFPYDSDTTTGVVNTALVEEILPRGLLVQFSVQDDDGELTQYALIKNFHRHQVINKPSKPLLPDWEKGDKPETYARRVGAKVQVMDGSSTGALPECSSSTTPRNGEHGAWNGEGRTELPKPDGSGDSAGPPVEQPDDRFDEFWAVYPRKEGKKRARTAWRNLSKTKREAALADCATRYRQTEKQFIPHPTTYLHEERWNDEPVPVKKTHNFGLQPVDNSAAAEEAKRRFRERQGNAGH